MQDRSAELTTYSLYCDGSCHRNGQRDATGGWGFVIVDNRCDMILLRRHHPHRYSGATNNTMEMAAAIEGTTAAEDLFGVIGDLLVCSDSAYVVSGITTWVHRWRRNSWRTSSGSEVLNRDLWEVLYRINSQKSLLWMRLGDEHRYIRMAHDEANAA